jgi:hypothetical protein
VQQLFKFSEPSTCMPSIPKNPESEADLPDRETSANLTAALDDCSIEALQAVLQILKAQCAAPGLKK